MTLSRVDYIRITGILEFKRDSEYLDVTYNIEHSPTDDFTKSKMGVITLRLSEILDTQGLHSNEIENIASQLVEETLVRKRDKERTVNILHSDGLALNEWFICNTPMLRQ